MFLSLLPFLPLITCKQQRKGMFFHWKYTERKGPSTKEESSHLKPNPTRPWRWTSQPLEQWGNKFLLFQPMALFTAPWTNYCRLQPSHSPCSKEYAISHYAMPLSSNHSQGSKGWGSSLNGRQSNCWPKRQNWARVSLLRIFKNKPIGEGNGTPHQYSCLESPMDRGAW